MKHWLKTWDLIRLVRLALGIAIIYQGLMSQQWIFVILGGLFSLMPLLNIGCCGPEGCEMPKNSYQKNIDSINSKNNKT